MQEKSENAAISLLLGLPSTLIRHKNGAFQKLPSNRTNLKTPALRSSVNRKHFNFENGANQKRRRHHNHVISLPKFSSNTKPRWPLIVAFSHFLEQGVDREHLIRFQNENV